MTGDTVLADGQAAALMVLGRKGQELPAAANTFVKKLYNIVTYEDDSVIAWNEGERALPSLPEACVAATAWDTRKGCCG
jgi:hypothetical protein